ncbi:hypothetical protein [Agromyces sp. ISL-38]|uniref:hypothetical protein n=1 Tax=Agromyces sp. ISL-38 TaxID=2819107 RepID=UPI001BEB0039|nr:hypothetical protein [Agromyces sp. ISL-38]MBT2518288.1 hypothetical protein [Streptomyces sp. ISL-90]
MAEIVVEIHVPLIAATGVAEGEYPFSWIDTIEEYIVQLDGERGEIYDDGEEFGEEYLFFVAGAPEAELLALAAAVAVLPGVPGGVYAMVTDSTALEFGLGRRVELN